MSDDDWETDPDHEDSRADPRPARTKQVRHRAAGRSKAGGPRTCKVHVCTSGACRNDGAHATLVELEELANLVEGCSLAQYNCFGLCGRGPNVSIDWDDGSSEMVSGARTTNQSLDIIHKACGVRPLAVA